MSESVVLMGYIAVSIQLLRTNFAPANFSMRLCKAKSMQQYLKPERYEFHIRRGRVLDDLLEETRKLAFHPLKRVQVSLHIDI